MTIVEKIAISRDRRMFTLHREGLFYKCYNEDAVLFAEQVKCYKISCKYVKSAGADVLSLGFPVREVEKGSLTFEKISSSIGAASYKEGTDGIEFLLKEDFKPNVEKFQEALISARESVVKLESSDSNTDIQKLLKMIQEFDLANNTPMQGMWFIQELKTYIKTIS